MRSREFGWQKYRKCTREALNINEITYDKMLKRIKDGAILIDVRTRQEFLEGHLEGAVLIPYYEIESKISGVIHNKDKEVILYCKNGGRSKIAYKVLIKLGYNNVFNLKGGIEEL